MFCKNYFHNTKLQEKTSKHLTTPVGMAMPRVYTEILYCDVNMHCL
jgi:hypothetical protein